MTSHCGDYYLTRAQPTFPPKGTELGYRVYVMNMHVSVCEGIHQPLPTLLITRTVNDNILLNEVKTYMNHKICAL